jgi:hypothetical protein
LKNIALLLLTIATLSGCAVSGHLYPVQGPLAAQTPLPIFDITLGHVLAEPISATLQNGEICKGPWGQVLPSDPSANKMSSEWDLVYGQGFFVANVLGSSSLYRGDLTGTAGTTLHVEFFLHNPQDMTSAKGMAQDNRGNVYKLMASSSSPLGAGATPAK